MRAHLEVWIDGPQNLRSFGMLWRELRCHRMVPVVCRLIEGSHAEWQHICKRMTNATFAHRCAIMRRKEVGLALDARVFREFATRAWRRRYLLRKALGCVSDPVTLRGMTVPSLLGLWYQSSLDTQFRNLAEDTKRKDAWDRAVVVKSTKVAQELPEADDALLKFLKSRMERKSCIWSVPEAVARGGDASLAW